MSTTIDVFWRPKNDAESQSFICLTASNIISSYLFCYFLDPHTSCEEVLSNARLLTGAELDLKLHITYLIHISFKILSCFITGVAWTDYLGCALARLSLLPQQNSARVMHTECTQVITGPVASVSTNANQRANEGLALFWLGTFQAHSSC